jgi:MATE family multidrug resistance protein
MAYGVVDTAMTGHASAQDLAALAIGSAIYYSVLVGLIGLVVSIGPILSQLYGAGDPRAIGRSFVQGLWVALFGSLIGGAVILFPGVWLDFAQVNDSLRAGATHYLQALMFSLPPILLFRVIYALNTSISRPKAVMFINLGGLALKIPLNHMLIYGAWGAPALGATGCGISTAIVTWLTCAMGFVTLRYDSFYRPFEIRAARPSWEPLREILRLGIPTALSYLIENTSFTLMALIIARLGAVSTGAHQIAINLAATLYSVPFALAVAISTLVGQAIGSADKAGAQHFLVVGFRIALGCAALIALSLYGLRGWLVSFYTNDPAVAQIALGLLAVVAFNHFFDTAQTVAGFALRAYKHAIAPMLVYTFCLWGIGLVGGYQLTFHGGLGMSAQGARGVWIGTTAGLLVAALALIATLGRVARAPLRPVLH